MAGISISFLYMSPFDSLSATFSLSQWHGVIITDNYRFCEWNGSPCSQMAGMKHLLRVVHTWQASGSQCGILTARNIFEVGIWWQFKAVLLSSPQLRRPSPSHQPPRPRKPGPPTLANMLIWTKHACSLNAATTSYFTVLIVICNYFIPSKGHRKHTVCVSLSLFWPFAIFTSVSIGVSNLFLHYKYLCFDMCWLKRNLSWISSLHLLKLSSNPQHQSQNSKLLQTEGPLPSKPFLAAH